MKTVLRVGFISWLGLATLSAATFTVTTTNDSGAGSLRQAIQDNGALGGGNRPVTPFCFGCCPQSSTLSSQPAARRTGLDTVSIKPCGHFFNICTLTHGFPAR